MRKIASLLLVAGVLAGCASAEYKDNSAQVARDPRCTDKPSNPDEEPPPWCKQSAGTTWSSDSKDSKLDFSGKAKDD